MKKYKFLILEDNPPDVELLQHELKKGGFVFDSLVVQNKNDFIKELKEFNPDLIFSDYSLPSFDGFSALKIVQESNLEIPIIFVSGVHGEEIIAQSTQNQGIDFVSKNEINLLVPVVHRVLLKAENKKKS